MFKLKFNKKDHEVVEKKDISGPYPRIITGTEVINPGGSTWVYFKSVDTIFKEFHNRYPDMTYIDMNNIGITMFNGDVASNTYKITAIEYRSALNSSGNQPGIYVAFNAAFNQLFRINYMFICYC